MAGGTLATNDPVAQQLATPRVSLPRFKGSTSLDICVQIPVEVYALVYSYLVRHNS